MNERIKELGSQAREYAHEQAAMMDNTYLRAFEDKFAELMLIEFTETVKQTAILVAQTAYSDGEDAVAVQKRVAGALRVLDVMREHFGVEE
jgi:hypothetical protein